MTYGDDRRLLEVLNPSDTSKKRLYSYKADGLLESIVGEDNVGKTEWAYDNFNRTDAEKRYLDSTTFDTWDLTYGLHQDQPIEVEDDDSKAIEMLRDDMGRKVKQVTPDNGTSIYVHDPAGNLVTHVEALGSADEMTHTFTYDSQNRLTAQDFGDPDCFTNGGPEIQYVYDSPSGCPSGTCVNSEGRLAYVKVKMFCDDTESDDTFDQLTSYGYDDAGRLVRERMDDDGGRIAIQNYTWNDGGQITSVSAPSSVAMKWTYDSAGRISSLIRNSGSAGPGAGTDITYVDNVSWYPFGPLKGYRQANTRNSNQILAKLTWDLGYRPVEILYEEESSGADLFEIDYTLDAQGRIAVRDFTNAHSWVRDSFYTYDWQNRVTCEYWSAGACPTSTIYPPFNNHISTPPYTPSGLRKTHRHTAGGFVYDSLTYTHVSGSSQIDYITRSNGKNVDFAWDARGNRLYDDDETWTTDRRDYTYDGRNNLITVTAKMGLPGNLIQNYVTTNAFDHKNRRVFKSILNADTDVEAHWFFYYDLNDRLIEAKHTPDISSSNIFTLFQFYWIEDRPVALVQTNYPWATVTRRFMYADEINTPLDLWTWPTSGDSARVWSYQPDAFGWGNVANSSVYQPLRFPGQYEDSETLTVRAGPPLQSVRPALRQNQYRVHDPFTGSYLQVDPKVSEEWEPYTYAANNPVGRTDSRGMSWRDDAWCATGAALIAIGLTKFGNTDDREMQCTDYHPSTGECLESEPVSKTIKKVRWGSVAVLGGYLVAEHCPDSTIVGCLIFGECGGSSGSTAGCMGGPEAGCPAYFGKPAYGSPASCHDFPIGGLNESLFDQNGGLPEPQIPDLSCLPSPPKPWELIDLTGTQ